MKLSVQRLAIAMILLMCLSCCGIKEEKLVQEPFNFQEILTKTSDVALSQPAYLQASDGTKLAYYTFIPATQPKATFIFYHGGGMWSNALYQQMAQKLVQEFPVAVYLVDLRGHGNSQGLRGDAPSAARVYDDIDVVVRFAKEAYPAVPLLLGGHSSGAGLVVNYAGWSKNDMIDGYVLLAPFLGGDSETGRTDQHFVKKVRTLLFIANALSGGRWFNHIPAVFFNYPEWLMKQDPLIVNTYSTAMAAATSPYQAKTIFQAMKKPCAIFVGADDEQFLPEKIVAFKNFLSSGIKAKSNAEILPDAKHLTLILQAPELLAKVIERFVATSSFSK